MHQNKITKNRCTVCVLSYVQLELWCEDAQTKRTRLRPWCGDDAWLGWGVLTTQAVVGAKAAQHHDGIEERKKVFAQEDVFLLVRLYVG